MNGGQVWVRPGVSRGLDVSLNGHLHLNTRILHQNSPANSLLKYQVLVSMCGYKKMGAFKSLKKSRKDFMLWFTAEGPSIQVCAECLWATPQSCQAPTLWDTACDHNKWGGVATSHSLPRSWEFPLKTSEKESDSDHSLYSQFSLLTTEVVDF